MPNIDQAVLDGMTDDQLIALASNLPAAAPDNGGAGGSADAASMMADVPQTRDDLIAALVALGEDQATLDTMTDDDLRNLWAQLTGADLSAMSDQSKGGANGGGGGKSARQPSKVTLQFAERQAQASIQRVRTLNGKLAAEERKLVDRLTALKRQEVDKFCERLVTEGRIRPVDVDVYAAALMALADDKPTHKFSETAADGKTVKTEMLTPFVAKMRELAKLPVIIKFGEKLGGQPGDGKTTAEQEVDKVRKFSEMYGHQFKKDLVAEFGELQEKNPKLTAKQYIGPDLVD